MMRIVLNPLLVNNFPNNVDFSGFQIKFQSIYVKNVVKFGSKILNLFLENNFLCPSKHTVANQ